MVVLLVLLTIAIVISVQLLFEHAEARKAKTRVYYAPDALPATEFLHKGHVWARLDTSGVAKVGVDSFLRKVLGGADRIFLPREGSRVKQGERVFSVLRNGREIDLVAPLDGVVESVNGDAKLDGWLFSIRPENLAASLRNLRGPESAAGWLEGEAKRFATFLVSDPVRYAGVGATMQDGGQYPAGIVDRLSREQFEAFREQFLA